MIKNSSKNNQNNPRPWRYIILFFIGLLVVSFVSDYRQSSCPKIKVAKFEMLLKNRYVKSIALNRYSLTFYVTLTERGKVQQNIAAGDFGPHYRVPVDIFYIENYYRNFKAGRYDLPGLDYMAPTTLEVLKANAQSIFSFLFFILMMIAFFFFDLGGLGMGFGVSMARVWDKRKRTGVRLRDVIGMLEAKVQLRDVINYFRFPKRYKRLGARPPKGAIMIGPPGTGKTLLAKAIAGESSVPLISVSGSEFEEVFVGRGAQRVRKLFEMAREMAPCIIFIDEIDTVGRKRSMSGQTRDTNEQTLNQLLTEIDGFNTSNLIFVLAATNRPNLIDSALMRPGRLGLKVFTSYPTKKERAATFQYYLRKMRSRKDIAVDVLAYRTVGCSYADIAEMCNRAALIAVNNSCTSVTMKDLNEAIDEKIAGIKRSEPVFQPGEKGIVAVHEIGHAFVGHCLEKTDPLVRISIMPRTDSTLGFAQYQPRENVLHQKSYWLDEMCMCLGGRAAEMVFFDQPSTGAQNDLEYVTKMVYAMILVYGMTEEIGPFSFYDSENPNDYTFTDRYSQQTKDKVDHLARKIVDEQMRKAMRLIKKYKAKVAEAANILEEKEEISAEEFIKIVGPKSSFVERLEKATTKKNKDI